MILPGDMFGVWILMDSDVGKKMNLDKDSFIVVDKNMKWPSYGLTNYWGHCPIVSVLIEKLKQT
jgi:hypothetical protein